MPRTTQIIPKYKFPFIETFYNDYSGWDDVESTAPVISGTRLMCFFASSKGIDNKLVTKYGLSEFLEEYGNVDFKQFGQPMLNAYEALSTGNAIVHCMRVLPDDANRANAILSAKVKVVTKADESATVVAIPKTFKAIPKTNEGEMEAPDTYTNELSWSAVGNAATYDVCINGEESNLVNVSEASYNHDGLTKETTYSYKVRAVTAEGKKSEWSNTIDVEAGAEGATPVTAEDKEANTQVPDYMEIKYYVSSVDSLRSVDDVESELDEMAGNTDPDENGYITVPIMALYSLGRGIYGNNYAIRIVDSPMMTNEYGVSMQQIELYDTTDGFDVKEIFHVSFNPSVIYGKESLFAADIITNPESGSAKIGAYANEEAFDIIKDMYTKAFPDANIDNEDYNFITGLEADSKTFIPNLKIVVPEDDTTDGFISLSEPTGIDFGYGSDGSLAKNSASFDTTLEKCYASAINAEYDTGVISKRRFPTEVILDANLSHENKLNLSALTLKRGDNQLILDAGLLKTKFEVLSWADEAEIAGINDWAISKTFQNAIVKDPFTGRRINVTDTFFYAKMLPTHYQKVGKHIPMVGEDYGRCDGIVSEKIYPMVEYDDTDFKAKLKERQLIYIEAVASNTFVIGNQDTSLLDNSDLQEMSNVAILLEMKRLVENIVIKNTYKFAEADDRARYTKDAKIALEIYDGMVRQVDILFDMNAFEEQRSIIHCYLSVTFKTLVKNGIVEIDINNRVSAAA